MKKELDDLLCEKYPLIFADRHGDMRQTCMVWGFEHGDGWFNLIDTLCCVIQNHIDGRHRDIEWVTKFNADLEIAKENNWQDWPTYATRETRKVPEPIQQVVAIQVKEKYGTLRFYYSGGDEWIDGVVSFAESLSAVTCEVCGSPGETIGEHWLETRCPEHSPKEA